MNLRSIQTDFISLASYQEKHSKVLATFSLPDAQKTFSALPELSLRYCREDSDRFPIVVLVDKVPVGFFVLHIGENIREYTDNKDSILLRGFLIDHNHQGKKYGKKTMEVLPEFAAQLFPGKDRIVLAVNVKNVAAKALYLNSGFQYTGVKVKGMSGWMHIMEYKF